jgi:hypothetical protein
VLVARSVAMAMSMSFVRKNFLLYTCTTEYTHPFFPQALVHSDGTTMVHAVCKTSF